MEGLVNLFSFKSDDVVYASRLCIRLIIYSDFQQDIASKCYCKICILDIGVAVQLVIFLYNSQNYKAFQLAKIYSDEAFYFTIKRQVIYLFQKSVSNHVK